MSKRQIEAYRIDDRAPHMNVRTPRMSISLGLKKLTESPFKLHGTKGHTWPKNLMGRIDTSSRI